MNSVMRGGMFQSLPIWMAFLMASFGSFGVEYLVGGRKGDQLSQGFVVYIVKKGGNGMM
jgi:hypothetical protein